MSTEPFPTIGRIVLYRGTDNAVRPAIVTRVHGLYCIGIHVFGNMPNDSSAGIQDPVTHADPVQEPACFPSWHWMPYQKQQHAAGTSVHAEPKT